MSSVDRPTSRRSRSALGITAVSRIELIAALGLALLASSATAAVDHADDVCAPSANPCNVAGTIMVVSGARLDFGLRELRIGPGGRIDIGAGSAEVLCGRFNAQTPGQVAITARGPSGGGSQDGGILTLRARGKCAGDATRACLDDEQCDIGFCNLGACGGDPSVDCDGHEDCDLGACSPTGSVSLLGRIEAQGDSPGSILIEASGDVLLGEDIDVDSTDADTDGGEVEIISHQGSVTLSGRIEATAGRNSTGGTVGITAGKNATVAGLIDASGGDFDGGEIDVLAGENLTLSGTVRIDATNGEGAGGFLSLDAGQTLRLTPTADLSADGHLSADNFGGDGGTYFFSSAGNVSIEGGAFIGADGARPDAAAGTVDIAAGGDVTIAGELSVIARGTQGIGGSVTATACGVAITAGALIDNRGEGGENTITSPGLIQIAAGAALRADARTGSNMLRYRDINQRPRVLGSVTPAADLRHIPGIAPCGGTGSTTTSSTTTTLVSACGNGTVEAGEDCDDGDTFFVRGDACSAGCARVECGDPDNSHAVNATDALIVLRVAVGLEACDLCICNVDSVGDFTSASDALRVLNAAVGLPVALECLLCVP